MKACSLSKAQTRYLVIVLGKAKERKDRAHEEDNVFVCFFVCVCVFVWGKIQCSLFLSSCMSAWKREWEIGCVNGSAGKCMKRQSCCFSDVLSGDSTLTHTSTVFPSSITIKLSQLSSYFFFFFCQSFPQFTHANQSTAVFKCLSFCLCYLPLLLSHCLFHWKSYNTVHVQKHGQTQRYQCSNKSRNWTVSP